MELNCPEIYDVTQQLGSQGYQMPDHFITSDALTGIEVLIGTDYFSCFISQQKREKRINMIITRDRGVIPFEPLPKWVADQQSSSKQFPYAPILCEDNPDISKLCELDRISNTKGEFSPSKRETVSQVRSNSGIADRWCRCLTAQES